MPEYGWLGPIAQPQLYNTLSVQGLSITYSLETAPPPPIPRSQHRRGDHYNSGLRTIKADRIIWHGHHYYVTAQPGEEAYTGQLEGLRGVFHYQPWIDPHRIQLQYLYDAQDKGKQFGRQRQPDGRIIVAKIWRNWVRLDLFEGEP